MTAVDICRHQLDREMVRNMTSLYVKDLTVDSLTLMVVNICNKTNGFAEGWHLKRMGVAVAVVFICLNVAHSALNGRHIGHLLS